MVVIQSRWTGLKLCRLHHSEALPKWIPEGFQRDLKGLKPQFFAEFTDNESNHIEDRLPFLFPLSQSHVDNTRATNAAHALCRTLTLQPKGFTWDDFWAHVWVSVSAYRCPSATLLYLKSETWVSRYDMDNFSLSSLSRSNTHNTRATNTEHELTCVNCYHPKTSAGMIPWHMFERSYLSAYSFPASFLPHISKIHGCKQGTERLTQQDLLGHYFSWSMTGSLRKTSKDLSCLCQTHPIPLHRWVPTQYDMASHNWHDMTWTTQ